MIHDEKPSDVWWHDTDTEVLRIVDKISFQRYTTNDYIEVTAHITSIRYRCNNAFLIHGYHKSAGKITADEYSNVKRWLIESIEQTRDIELEFLAIRKAEVLKIPETELEISELSIKKKLGKMREHLRDNYLLYRKAEATPMNIL
jgi:hypothetical protein